MFNAPNILIAGKQNGTGRFAMVIGPFTILMRTGIIVQA